MSRVLLPPPRKAPPPPPETAPDFFSKRPRCYFCQGAHELGSGLFSWRPRRRVLCHSGCYFHYLFIRAARITDHSDRVMIIFFFLVLATLWAACLVIIGGMMLTHVFIFLYQVCSWRRYTSPEQLN